MEGNTVKDLTSLFHWGENIYNSLSLGEIILIVVPASIVVTLIYLITNSVFRAFLYRFSNKGYYICVVNGACWVDKESIAKQSIACVYSFQSWYNINRKFIN